MMKKNKLVLVLLLFVFSNHNLLAQKIEVKGKVVTFNSVPVVYANVMVPGSETPVKTDLDGSFTCTCHEKDKLLITAAGFKELSIKVKKKNSQSLIANMRLLKSAEASKLAIKKGHILQIDQFEKLRKTKPAIKDYSKYSDYIEILKNEFPSLRIVNRSVMIRGETSIVGSNLVLYELNGNIIDQSMIEDLPTSEIASIKVIKGNAAAIYGLRGGQGVISIKTKQGGSK